MKYAIPFVLRVSILLGAVICASLNDSYSQVRKPERRVYAEGIFTANQTGPVLALSMYQLIQDSRPYIGKRVHIFGYLAAGFEDYGIYANKDAYTNRVMTDGIGLILDDEELKVAERLHGQFVVIQGIIKAARNPGVEGYGAAMESISRLESMERPKNKLQSPMGMR